MARVEGSDPERTAGRVETREDAKDEATAVRDVPAYVPRAPRARLKYSNLRRNRGEIGVGQRVTSQTKPSRERPKDTDKTRERQDARRVASSSKVVFKKKVVVKVVVKVVIRFEGSPQSDFVTS